METLVKFKKVNPLAKEPVHSSTEAIGADLHSVENHWINPRSRQVIDTGVSVQAVDSDFYLRIASRSGLASKGIDVGAGVVDKDYTGTLKVILINNNDLPFQVQAGDRIAQLILERANRMRFHEVTELVETERGEGGLGSTGVK